MGNMGIDWVSVPNLGYVSRYYILKTDWDNLVSTIGGFSPVVGSSNSLYELSADPLILGISPNEPTSPEDPATPVFSTAPEFVTMITWYEVMIWCNALSIELELDPVYLVRGVAATEGPFRRVLEDGKVYVREVETAVTNGVRLLTQAEWGICRDGSYIDPIIGVDEWLENKGRTSLLNHERFIINTNYAVECNALFKLPQVTFRVVRGA
jgi:hypothetical protein